MVIVKIDIVLMCKNGHMTVATYNDTDRVAERKQSAIEFIRGNVPVPRCQSCGE